MSFTEAIDYLNEQAKAGNRAYIKCVNSRPGQFYSVAVICNRLDPDEPEAYQYRLHAPNLMSGNKPVPFVPAHFTNMEMVEEFEIYEPAA